MNQSSTHSRLCPLDCEAIIRTLAPWKWKE